MKKLLPMASATLLSCTALAGNTHQSHITPFVGVAVGHNTTNYDETRASSGMQSNYGGDGWTIGAHVGAVFYKTAKFSLAADAFAYSIDSKHETKGRSAGDRINKMKSMYGIAVKPGMALGSGTAFVTFGLVNSRYTYTLVNTHDEKASKSGGVFGIGFKLPVTDHVSVALTADYITAGSKVVGDYTIKPKPWFSLLAVDYRF